VLNTYCWALRTIRAFEEQVRDSPSPARFRSADCDQFGQFLDVVGIGSPHNLWAGVRFAAELCDKHQAAGNAHSCLG